MGILRHLLKYRPDIAFAVHEASKTLAIFGDADLRRLRRLGRYLSRTQKLGIMMRKSNDLQHLDAYTDAERSVDSINRKSTSAGILKIGSATLREFTKGQSCQTLSSGESEYYAAVTTTAGIAPPATPEILGNAGQAPIENRFDSSSRHHPETGVPLRKVSTLKTPKRGGKYSSKAERWGLDTVYRESLLCEGRTRTHRVAGTRTHRVAG